MKRLMLGNEAVARGVYEAGAAIVSSYPGTPSTEITEFCAKYDDIYCEWAPNEKVALETAIGASIAGARSFCAMKHVGLNVAADPMFTMSYSGVTGGLVIAVADDPGMHSSQNEQDSRHYAAASKIPMLEPSDSAECKEFTKLAFELSEKFDTPVLLRLSTRVSHSQSIVELEKRQPKDIGEYKKNPQKYVMMPAYAKGRHVVVEERTRKIKEYLDTGALVKVERGGKIGIISSGAAYLYAKEALGDKASYLKLNMTWPLPDKCIVDFAKTVDELYVLEELDDIIEQHCLALGLDVKGKKLFSLLGEYSANEIKRVILGEDTPYLTPNEQLPNRPPVLCPGCPHRGIFYVLSKLKVMVSGDIGCYTLGAMPPLGALDTTICMGASISGLHGFNKARADLRHNSVAVIGDSTFIHSGITGLIDIAYNQGTSKIIILDNSITGMTGHQQNPTTGYTIKGDPTYAVNLEQLVKSVGIKNVVVVDPFDIDQCEAEIKKALASDEPYVIIARRPCALLKYVKHKKPLKVNTDKCIGCKACMKVGCPAITVKDKKARVDETLCVGCDLCAKMCRFGALEAGE